MGLLAVGCLALGCRQQPSEMPPAAWTFVRSGLLETSPQNRPQPTPTLLDAQRQVVPTTPIELTNRRRLFEFAWQPEAVYRLVSNGAETELIAPRYPSPALLWKIPLENVNDAAASGTWPDCVVAFSPDSRWLAIGSFAGWIRVVDCLSGEVAWSQRLAEGMIKRLAWSPAGERLYVGEQSPDGRLWAFDLRISTANKLAPRPAWSVRLADYLETSRPPPHDRFGIYTLPAVYDVRVAADGRVFVAGTHRWPVAGQLTSRSILLGLDAAGQQLWRYPTGNLSAESEQLTFFGSDDAGRHIALLATTEVRLATDAAPNTTAATQKKHSARFVQLDGRTGNIVGEAPIEPLRPHFERVESWDSVSVNDQADRAVLGLNDGRALLFDLSDAGPKLLREISLATPQLVGTTPIAASASYARFHGEVLCLQTQNTHIPFGSPLAANRPPIAHQGANTLTVCDRDGNSLWMYRGPYSLSGSWTDRPATGPARWLAVTCREQPGSLEPGNFGLLLFDLQAQGGGSDRLVYYYPTTGPAMFFADVSPDGQRIAVAETPTPTSDGRELYGAYQVHIVH